MTYRTVAVRASQWRKLDVPEVIADVAPRIAMGLLGDPLAQECPHGEADVSLDAAACPVTLPCQRFHFKLSSVFAIPRTAAASAGDRSS